MNPKPYTLKILPSEAALSAENITNDTADEILLAPEVFSVFRLQGLGCSGAISGP